MAMAEAHCSRHYGMFDRNCIRCGEAQAINEAVKRNEREKARREAEFAALALVPKESAATTSTAAAAIVKGDVL
jgi:hypothetical protein